MRRNGTNSQSLQIALDEIEKFQVISDLMISDLKLYSDVVGTMTLRIH
jgi:hypothetical protein